MKITTYKDDYGKNGSECCFEAGLVFWMFF